MPGERHEGRSLIGLAGADREPFLQGLVTNDVTATSQGIVYAALLTPQGKYLADFFIHAKDDRLVLDVDDALAPDLLKRLSLYRLRADVQIAPVEDRIVLRGLGAAPDGAHPDPRHPSLGWRCLAPQDAHQDAGGIDWTALRVAACVPESGIELVPGESFILEAGFARLNGVDFRKGCYVGQEVTARMKHKTELRKGLACVDVDGPAPPPGTPIAAQDGRAVGTFYSAAGNRGIAYLRFDRAQGEMSAQDARLRYAPELQPA